ncbi:MAG: tyrosine-type recombinase/integrase [Phycisphaeraceae bacterium]
MPKKKPEKPVWPHANVTRMTADMARNQWVKKIRGRVYNFGVLDDPDAALKKYQRIGPDLHAGRQPRTDENQDGLTLAELCGRYLLTRRRDLEAGKISRRTYRNYELITVNILEWLDGGVRVAEMTPQHFETLRQQAARQWGLTRQSTFAVWTRTIFNWAYDQRLISRPIEFGSFRGPTAREKRARRNRMAKNLFTPDEVRRLLVEAPPSLRAPIWLGLNAGMGNGDLAELTWNDLDLNAGRSEYARPKTEMQRAFPLWRETIAALREVQASPVKPRDPAHSNLVFLTDEGYPLQHGNTDALHLRFRRLLVRLKLVPAYGEEKPANQRNLGFYTLRRTFRTYAGEAKDKDAADLIMGHEIPGMAGIYIQKIGWPRLHDVVDHVYAYLFKGWTCKLENETEKTPDQ